MIEPIKQSLSFKGRIPSIYQNVAKNSSAKTTSSATSVSATTPQIQTETVNQPKSLKTRLMNMAKGYNDITNTSGGALRGIVEGLGTAALVGVFAKNLKEHNSTFFPTIGGTIKDIAKEAWELIKLVPKFAKEVIQTESVQTILQEPSKLWAKHIKGNNKAALAVILSGTLVFLYRTFEGKIRANIQNAKLDHALKEGHLPTK